MKLSAPAIIVRLLLYIFNCKILRRDLLCLPNSVGRQIQLIAVSDKAPGVDHKDNRFAVPLPHLHSGFKVRRDMNILPAHRDQAIPHNTVKESRCSSVIQVFRRLRLLHFNDNARYRVSLIGSDFRPVSIKGISPLFIVGNNLIQDRPADLRKFLFKCLYYNVYISPTAIQINIHRLGAVSKHI